MKHPFDPSLDVPTTTRTQSMRFSPSSSSDHSSGTSPQSRDPLGPQPSLIQKRSLNTQAARRYRQRKVDLVSNLETKLKETQEERDGLKERVARLEGELAALRSLVGK